ncbi:MAG: riboflavin synthase [Xanthomonadales bacterium]|nr:riboflavin synthase [Xanthomonadales bacterium]
MFTGLIQAVGSLRHTEQHRGGLRWWVDAGELLADGGELGESIAVSGVCLTAVAFDGAAFAADLAIETLNRTSLGRLTPGAPVNLERALLPTTRLGGHLVSGHVDGVGRVRSIADEGAGQRWYVDAPAELLRFIAVKGSICVEGISLTVTNVDTAGFAVALVPHTLEHTNLHALEVGSPVNLEVDQIARYVERLVQWSVSTRGQPSDAGTDSAS